MKKVLLINPYETEQNGFSNPPVGLLYIAGTLLENGINVQVVDGCMEGKTAVEQALVDFRPDFVGITCLTPGRKRALEIAEMAKRLNSGVKVALGGAHATIMYKQILEHYPEVDFIVLGEGEQAVLELVQGKAPATVRGLAYRNDGAVAKTPSRENVQNLDEVPFPAWQLIDLQKYPSREKGIVHGVNLEQEPRISVIFSRGCKGHCDFCSTWWIWKGWRHRSPKNMVDELELLCQRYNIRHFCFADDAMTVNKQATIELCDEIIARKLQIAFHVTTRTDCVDEEVLRKLKAAGCYKIAFGIESGSHALLENMGKENDILTSETAILLSKKAGIAVTALLIVGNIGETEQSVNDTIKFLRRTQPDEIGCVGGLWVLPGTRVYQECKRKGFIDDDFWLSDEPFKIYTLEYSLSQLAALQRRIVYYTPKIFIRNLVRKIGEMYHEMSGMLKGRLLKMGSGR